MRYLGCTIGAFAASKTPKKLTFESKWKMANAYNISENHNVCQFTPISCWTIWLGVLEAVLYSGAHLAHISDETNAFYEHLVFIFSVKLKLKTVQ